MIFSNFFKRILSIFNLKRKNYLFKPSLTFVGVGPGDPKLLTIAALDAISDASLVAFPIAKIGEESVAASIASDFTKNKKFLPILFPMVLDNDQLKRAWEEASANLIEEVNNGERVVLLCQGDPSLYATSSYIIKLIKLNHPLLSLKIIPGVSSFNAAAAEAQLPLVLNKEELLICPVPDSVSDLENLLETNVINYNKVVVLLKLGKRWTWVREVLCNMDLLSTTTLAKRVGFSDQEIDNASNISGKSIHYFSLLIIRSKTKLIDD